jgi:hypothetical protein
MLKNILIFVFMAFSMNALAQSKPDSTKIFTPDEFNLIVTYLQKGSIPALADSATMASVQTLKAKLDAVLTKKKPLATLMLTQQENNVIAYLMRDDINAAVTLLRLQQKIAPAAVNGKTENVSKK